MRTVLLLSFIAGLASSAACTVIEEPSAETGAAQGQPHGATAPAEHPAHAAPAAQIATHDARTRVMPLGYGNGMINVSTGLRTDPHGSEEGLLPTERLGVRGVEGPANRLPLEPSARAMWGAEGPGGAAGGSALAGEAPPTAPRVSAAPAPATRTGETAPPARKPR